MTDKEKFPYQKSYESDGVMGKDKKASETNSKRKNEKDDKMFFNTTELSE